MPCRVPTTGKPGVRRSGSARPAATTWERHDGAASAPLHYRRREPEKTLLHAVVREHLESFFAHARERSSHGRGLPAFVERDLRAYASCGILARGFARVRCPDCGFERLVAFSCKASICPSCATRRMEDGADHLVRNVFPAVPLRQWVLSFPRQVRFLAARHPALARRLLDLFTRAVFAWQRKAARRLGAVDPRTGGVTAVQRAGGAVNLNVHFHTLTPDGVFGLDEDGPARFVPLPPPEDEDVEAILRRVIRRTVKVLAPYDEGSEDDALAALQADEVDRRLRYPDPFPHVRRCAFLEGFSLHAGVRYAWRPVMRSRIAGGLVSQSSGGQRLRITEQSIGLYSDVNHAMRVRSVLQFGGVRAAAWVCLVKRYRIPERER